MSKDLRKPSSVAGDRGKPGAGALGFFVCRHWDAGINGTTWATRRKDILTRAMVLSEFGGPELFEERDVERREPGRRRKPKSGRAR